ncbi:MAG TPA: efflux RND transporter periplasmic adaptor subunit [Victivallales bacterium]|nr:efflux RND transporter periplasmic adaptor subunit [Victivallales bacterium]
MSNANIWNLKSILFFRGLNALFPLALILICSCGRDEKIADERKIPVETFKIIPGKVEDMLDTFGVIESLSTVEISSEQEGTVVDIFAKEGDYLKSGQIILKLDDRIYRAEEAIAQANLKFAESVLKRQKSLFGTKSVSEKDYEDAHFSCEKAKAEYEAAKTKLDRCEIRSPIDAFLDEISVEKGEYLSSGRRVATIEKTDIVKLVFRIPERDVNSIPVGTNVSYTFDSCPAERFEGEISFVSKAADMRSLAFRAEVDIENSAAKFRPGMIARVRLVRNVIDNAISIPIVAIIPRYGGHYVFVLKGGRAYQKEVKIAFFTADRAVISSGLYGGETIVVSGNRFLRERDLVQISGEEK